MSKELATVQNNTISPWLKAATAPCICKSEYEPMLELMIEVLGKCYFEAGQTKANDDPKTLLLTAQGLLSEINEQFKTLTTEDLKLCFKYGVRGEYGEFMGLNLSTFHKWLKAYIRSENRAKARREAEVRDNTPIYTTEEADQMWRDTITRQFTKYKETGKLDIYLPVKLYNRFRKLKLVNYTEAERNDFKKQAAQELIREKQLQRVGTVKSANELKSISAAISRFEKNDYNDKDNDEIVSKACEIAIKKYYDSIDTLTLLTSK